MQVGFAPLAVREEQRQALPLGSRSELVVLVHGVSDGDQELCVEAERTDVLDLEVLPALRARTLSDALVKGMGRSNGYRPNKANEAEVLRLRARLGKVRASEWQRAGCIMQQITSLIGKQGGPGNGMISPRACTGCGYYGHTKQWCKVKRARDADSELAIDEDRVYSGRADPCCSIVVRIERQPNMQPNECNTLRQPSGAVPGRAYATGT